MEFHYQTARFALNSSGANYVSGTVNPIFQRGLSRNQIIQGGTGASPAQRMGNHHSRMEASENLNTGIISAPCYTSNSGFPIADTTVPATRIENSTSMLKSKSSNTGMLHELVWKHIMSDPLYLSNSGYATRDAAVPAGKMNNSTSMLTTESSNTGLLHELIGRETMSGPGYFSNSDFEHGNDCNPSIHPMV